MKRTMIVVLLAAVALFAMVGTAHAATSVPGTVTVAAQINKTVTLTITGGSVNFGPVDAGGFASNSGVDIKIRSNAPYTVSRVPDSNCTTMGLNITTNGAGVFDGVAVLPKAPQVGGQDYPETYTITVPWTTIPAAYSGNVVYTVTAP